MNTIFSLSGTYYCLKCIRKFNNYPKFNNELNLINFTSCMHFFKKHWNLKPNIFIYTIDNKYFSDT